MILTGRDVGISAPGPPNMDEKELLTAAGALVFLCPGLVFVFIYRILRLGREPEVTKDNVVAYVAVSAIYNVVAGLISVIPFKLLDKKFTIEHASASDRLNILIYAVVFPAFLGILYYIINEKKLFYRFARLIGTNALYPAPTAWETSLERIAVGDFVIATLKDGRSVSGNIDSMANFSSKEDCYDMLISETDPPDGQSADVARATWIASGEVSTLEIVYPRPRSEPEQRLFFRQVSDGEANGR